MAHIDTWTMLANASFTLREGYKYLNDNTFADITAIVEFV